MTNDTLKSLGYLEKSLKMTRRAVEKNSAADGTDANQVKSFQDKIDVLRVEIDTWRKMAAVPTAPTATVTPVSNAPSAPVTNDGSALLS